MSDFVAVASSFAAAPRAPLFNISTRRVGAIRFVKIGRLCFSFCVTREYRSL